MNCSLDRDTFIQQELSKLNHYGKDAMRRYKLYHMNTENCHFHGLLLPIGCWAFFVFCMGVLGKKKRDGIF